MFHGKHMNWKHLKCSDRSMEIASQSMSATQAGKAVKFLVWLPVDLPALVALMVLAVDLITKRRLRDRVTPAIAILIIKPKLGFFTFPNHDQT